MGHTWKKQVSKQCRLLALEIAAYAHKLAVHFGVTIRYLVGEEIESSGDEELARMFRQAGELGSNDRAFLEDMIQQAYDSDVS